LTIRGACSSNATADAKSCAVRLSRRHFEMMFRLALSAPLKGMPPSPRDVAKEYVDAVIYGKAGERAGLDRDGRFADIVRLARQRALADIYRVHMEEEANEISAAEIERRYKQNLRHFDEVKLSHVSVVKQDGSGKSDSQKARQIASELHERAAHGADMDKLQHEASEKLGVKNAPPALLQPIRRGALEQQTENEVYALAPGQVTTVKELPNAFVFYRLDSRRTVPLSEATPEIRSVLYREKLEKLTRAATASLRADYNEQYFKAFAAPDKLSATAALHEK